MSVRWLAILLVGVQLASGGCGGDKSGSPPYAAAVGNDSTVEAAALRAVRRDLEVKNDVRSRRPAYARAKYASFASERIVRAKAYELASALQKVLPRGWRPFESVRVTARSWGPVQRSELGANVQFVGYRSMKRDGEPWVYLPLERFYVTLVEEQGELRLLNNSSRWLSDDGPLGRPGNEAPLHDPLNGATSP
jgi:hypothetical protein